MSARSRRPCVIWLNDSARSPISSRRWTFNLKSKLPAATSRVPSESFAIGAVMLRASTALPCTPTAAAISAEQHETELNAAIRRDRLIARLQADDRQGVEAFGVRRHRAAAAWRQRRRLLAAPAPPEGSAAMAA